jgi:predicted RND superfamily exporter protein
MSRLFGGVAAATARRPWPVVIVAALLAGLALWAASGMGTQPVTDAFFDRESESYRLNEEAERAFGSDPVVVMAKGPLVETLTTENQPEPACDPRDLPGG